MRVDRLLRIDVHRVHEPARKIGSNRQEGQPDRCESIADLLEVLPPAGVASEVDVARLRCDHESAPQTAIAIGDSPRAEMAGGNGGDPVPAFPPAELDRVLNA